MQNFSLSLSLARTIHMHQTEPSKNRVIRFCQQELLDRVLGASFSALALLDISFHLTAATVKGLRAYYHIFKFNEPSSFKESIRHLKIASLFYPVLLKGSSLSIANPLNVKKIFSNPLAELVRALLLSGSPQVFQNPSLTGEVSHGNYAEILDEFLTHTQNLPQDIQDSMQDTLILVKEAIEDYDLTTFFYSHNEKLVHYWSLDFFYKKITSTFDQLRLNKKDSFNQICLKEIIVRVYIVGLSTLSLPLSLISTIQAIALLNTAFFNLILENVYRSELCWLAILNIVSSIRCLLAAPLCLTLGLFFPYQVQSLFFSPLYKNDHTQHEIITKIIKKIENLSEGKSYLIPLMLNTADPSTNHVMHAWFVLVKKCHSHYQLSIINRGFGSGSHPKRGKDKNDVDCSWANVEISFLQNYLSFLLKYQDISFAKKLLDFCKDKLPDNYHLLLGLIYTTPDGDFRISTQDYQLELTGNPLSFESHHIRSKQKIGNCAISNLLGSLSFHSAMQTGNFQDKRVYKKFIYTYKKMMLEKYDYLLDFDVSTLKASTSPSAIAYQKLEKARQKLTPSFPMKENHLS